MNEFSKIEEKEEEEEEENNNNKNKNGQIEIEGTSKDIKITEFFKSNNTNKKNEEKREYIGNVSKNDNKKEPMKKNNSSILGGGIIKYLKESDKGKKKQIIMKSTDDKNPIISESKKTESCVEHPTNIMVGKYEKLNTQKDSIPEKAQTARRGRKRKNQNETIESTTNKDNENKIINTKSPSMTNRNVKKKNKVGTPVNADNNNNNENDKDNDDGDTTNSNNKNKNNNLKSKKFSLINIFGPEINITVKVEDASEDIEQPNTSFSENSSDDSFKIKSSKNKSRGHDENRSYLKEKERIRSMYKRNSISDYEEYETNILDNLNPSHESIQVTSDEVNNDYHTNKRTNQSTNKMKRRDTSLLSPMRRNNKKKGTMFLTDIENEFSETSPIHIPKSDIESSQPNLKRKRTMRARNRNSCIGIELDEEINKIPRKLMKRTSCLHISELNNSNKNQKETNENQIKKGTIGSSLFSSEKQNPLKERNKEREAKDADNKENEKEEPTSGSQNAFFKVLHVEDKLSSIKNKLQLNENVNDILDEKKRIKTLRILNKVYFDKEYNNLNDKYGRKKKKKIKSFELLKDSSNKPCTFFIIGSFIFFSNYVLIKKLKNLGYNITDNFRRCNCVVVGYNMSSSILLRLSDFHGKIFNEKKIIQHLMKQYQKYLILFRPINKYSGKKFYLHFSPEIIKHASISYIKEKLLNLCVSCVNIIKELEQKQEEERNELFSKKGKQKIEQLINFLEIANEKFVYDIKPLYVQCKRNYEYAIGTDQKTDLTAKVLPFFKSVLEVLLSCEEHTEGLVWKKDSLRTLEELHFKESDIPIKIENEKNQENHLDVLHKKTIVDKFSCMEYNSTLSTLLEFPFDSSSIDEIEEIKKLENCTETESCQLNEKQVLHNMKRIQILTNKEHLWNDFFNPNSLYEIAGHKNEILALYRFLKKAFSDTMKNLTYDHHGKKREIEIDKNKKSQEKKRNVKKKEEKNNNNNNNNNNNSPSGNILFLMYPPNSGVKRLVELTCYTCDLCPIYENKVQKYKNINYYFKCTHGLKAISIYNANKLDKNAMAELNQRNDICICLYEDKNFIMNRFNHGKPSLLDNITHTFIKFSTPPKKALIYRCYVAFCCVIKNLQKKIIKILFELCKLRNHTYSIESVYHKLHLLSIYLKSEKKQTDFLEIPEPNKSCLIQYPNNVIYNYMMNHLMNPFLIENYDDIYFKMEIIGISEEEKQIQEKRRRDLKKLNEDYYFYAGFESEEIQTVVYNHFDTLHIKNKNVLLDFSVHKAYINEENVDYQYNDIVAKRKRETALILTENLYLYSSILLKTKDSQISLLALDFAIYWKNYLFMNNVFKKKRKTKEERSILHKERTEHANYNNYINELKLQDHLKNKMEKCNKVYSERIRKYKNLMFHFKSPFNFSSAHIIYDIMQSNKFVNFANKRNK